MWREMSRVPEKLKRTAWKGMKKFATSVAGKGKEQWQKGVRDFKKFQGDLMKSMQNAGGRETQRFQNYQKQIAQSMQNTGGEETKDVQKYQHDYIQAVKNNGAPASQNAMPPVPWAAGNKQQVHADSQLSNLDSLSQQTSSSGRSTGN